MNEEDGPVENVPLEMAEQVLREDEEENYVPSESDEREMGDAIIDTHTIIDGKGFPLSQREADILRSIPMIPDDPEARRHEIGELLEIRDSNVRVITGMEKFMKEQKYDSQSIGTLHLWVQQRELWQWTPQEIETFFSAGDNLPLLKHLPSILDISQFTGILREFYSLFPEERTTFLDEVMTEMAQEHAASQEWAREYVEPHWREMSTAYFKSLKNYIEKSPNRGDKFESYVRKKVANFNRQIEAKREIHRSVESRAINILGRRPKHEFISPKYFGTGIKGMGQMNMLFTDYLAEIGYNPDTYLKTIRKKAKEVGYDPSSIRFATNSRHKLEIETPAGRIVRFGRVGYGDFLILSFVENRGDVEKGFALQKQRTFHASHSKIRGNWKSNDFSPNNLALRLLW
jgi:hypothetical protein